ncbi:hypothetical protein FI667_g2067, partial [Globisporangium splendens]
MATTTRATLSWEKFEELAKVAFVADPHADTRFFLKTRVAPASKAAVGQKKPNKSNVKIVARVATRPKKQRDRSAGESSPQVKSQSIQYQTLEVNALGRLTRLLRFVMQEVLGPMKAGASAVADKAAAAPPPAPVSATNADKNKKKKKKKGGKK